MDLHQSVAGTEISQGCVRDCPHRHGARLCLLKGCEQWFQPAFPQARYCSQALPASCLSLAAVASVAPISRGRSSRPGTTSGAERSIPAAATGIPTSRRIGRVTRGARSGLRGPARSRNSGRIRELSVRPSGLLRVVRASGAFTAATFLLPGLPSGVTSRSSTRTAPPGASSSRPSQVWWSFA